MTDMGQPEFVSTSFHVLYKMFIIGREFILGRGVREICPSCEILFSDPSFEGPFPWKTTSFDGPHITCTYVLFKHTSSG